MHFSSPPQEVLEALRRLTPDALRRICEVASARDSEVRNLVLYEASTGRGRQPAGPATFSAAGEFGPRDDTQQPEHFRWASNSFMLFSFKVKPCTNRAPHNFRTCPFGHPPNWIRRDPRQCRYVPVPCPYHAAGSCTLENCPYAHSLLECSLHPYNYRNSRCRHGLRCTETVCFFAHSDQELRKPSKQYSPSLEEFKVAESARPGVDKSKVDQDALVAAEAKARTLLRSTSPGPDQQPHALNGDGKASAPPNGADWPPLPGNGPGLGPPDVLSGQALGGWTSGAGHQFDTQPSWDLGPVSWSQSGPAVFDQWGLQQQDAAGVTAPAPLAAPAVVATTAPWSGLPVTAATAPGLLDGSGHGGGQHLSAAHWTAKAAASGPQAGATDAWAVSQALGGFGGAGGGEELLRRGVGLAAHARCLDEPGGAGDIEHMLALMRLQSQADEGILMGWNRSLPGHASAVNS